MSDASCAPLPLPRVMRTGESARIPGLDGLRALSVAMVVVGHSLSQRGWPEWGWTALIKATIGNDQLGVETFFVLSGLLITRLLMREVDSTSSHSLRRFYLRRAFRIFPAYYLFLSTILVLCLRGAINVPRAELMGAAFYIWNYMPHAHNWFVAHTWSLCVEEQFYLLWPIALLLMGRQRALRFVIWILIASPGFRILTYLALPAFQPKLNVLFHTRIDAIAVGCVIALLPRTPQGEALLNVVYRPVVRAGAALMIFAVIPVAKLMLGAKFFLSFGVSVQAVSVGILVAWIANHPTSMVSRRLDGSALRFIGVRSYGVYLWQQLLVATPVGLLNSMPLTILVLLVVASASYSFLERPLLGLRDRLVPF